MTADEGRPSSSSTGTPNALVMSTTSFPFQLARAFATSRCCENGMARNTTFASSASASDWALIVGPISRARGQSDSGGRLLATATSMFLRANSRATARHSHQKRVGISDEARQYRDAQPLARCENLGLGVCGFECRSVDGNVVVARPIGNAFVVPDDPADGTVRTSSPVGKQSA